MKFRLVEAEYDEKNTRPVVGGRALRLIDSRCQNIDFPSNPDDPFYQGLINLLDEETDGFKDLSLNVPFVKFLYNINNNSTFRINVDFKTLFDTVDNMNNFNSNILPTLKDIKIFKPYGNCYNKSLRECSYLCRVIDAWFGDDFERYFGNIMAEDTGVKSLSGEEEKLEQSDFGYLFTTNHLEDGIYLLPSGLPNSTRLDTVYGMVEHLTELNEAKIRGNIQKNKRSTASEDEVRTMLKDVKSNGEALSDEAVEQIVTGLKFK